MGKKDRFDYFAAFERQVKVAAAEADILIEAIEGFSAAADFGHHFQTVQTDVRHGRRQASRATDLDDPGPPSGFRVSLDVPLHSLRGLAPCL